MELTKNRFLLYTLLSCLLAVGAVVGINYTIDTYGLFTGKKDRFVYANERTSKYLFSYRYIPENFEGFIIGPSLSANLDPKQLKGYKVYNASIMGANISELDYLVDKIIEKGHMKFAIVCLDPYLTKDFGKKSANIDPKEYWGALGSTNLCKTYFLQLVRKYNLMPGKYAANIYNEYGWNNFELEMHGLDPQKAIEDKVKNRLSESTDIDPQAYLQLEQTLNKLRQHHIKVIGYFSPVPYQLHAIGIEGYTKFENQIQALFKEGDVVVNLNEEKYKPFTNDYHTYIDHGHLSAQGQTFVLGELQKAIDGL